ncbi:MAG: NUDIX domain-containing protein [Candidatus Pacebacteria bacterium]|nr:NUDIX domain-containing protein [Candidatus Paceibacterota bacterium]
MPKVIASAKALIQNQNKFLIIKELTYKSHVWDLPGGKVEYGENPEDTVKREVQEELDIQINLSKSIGLWWFFSANHRHQVICHTFLAQPEPGFKINTSKNPSDEQITDWQWLTKTELLKQNAPGLTESFKKMLQKADL